MKHTTNTQGISTLMNHLGETHHAEDAHVMPIYQTSAFGAPAWAELDAKFAGTAPGYYYTRAGNPNAAQVAEKIAALEALDWLRAHPDTPLNEMVQGEMFASGMGAISAGLLARLHAGDVLLAQRAIYGGTYGLLRTVASKLGIQVVWVKDDSQKGWEAAFAQYPHATMVYAETPINPSLKLVDLTALSALAHDHNAWVMVDNTFATPYCQRPLTLGADIVVHSTTKFLSGHGAVIGGALVSPQLDFMQNDVRGILQTVGASPSPFDGWLTHLGLKTFELRMEKHCDNTKILAKYLAKNQKVTQVNYPGLETHPQHTLARQQMHAFGGMLSFELAGGFEAGVNFINRVQIATMIGSLGNVDTLVSHPASMSHRELPRETRLATGIPDGLVRVSVGIENIEDLLQDFERALGG